MKLSEYAERYGIPYAAAYRHLKAGLIPGAYTKESGVHVIPDDHDFSKFPRFPRKPRARDAKGLFTSKTQTA